LILVPFSAQKACVGVNNKKNTTLWIFIIFRPNLKESAVLTKYSSKKKKTLHLNYFNIFVFTPALK